MLQCIIRTSFAAVAACELSENNFNFPMLIWSSLARGLSLIFCMQQLEPLVMEAIMPNETDIQTAKLLYVPKQSKMYKFYGHEGL